MIAHRPMNYKNYYAFDTLMLQLDMDCEVARMGQYMKLLGRYGMNFANTIHLGDTPIFNQIDKRCFDAAYAVATGFGLIYCEGILLIDSPTGKIPLGHGWCCTHDGRLVDPTMHKYQDDHRIMYVGVPIRRDYVARWEKRVGFIGVLDGYPDGADSPIYTDPPSLWLDDVNG